MSNKASSWAWDQQSPDLKPPIKFVLCALADNADDSGYVWSGYRYVANKTGLARRTVISHISWLEQNGYLVKEERLRQDGSNTSNGYYLQLERGGANAAPGGANTAPSSDEVAPGGVQELHPGGDGAAPQEPLREPSSEPSKEPSWSAPTWWEPLIALKGYSRKNYAKSQEIIEVGCKQGGVDPAAVVNGFANYWPVGSLQHGWVDPVRALTRTLNVQIAKARSKNGTRPGSTRAEVNRDPSVYGRGQW